VRQFVELSYSGETGACFSQAQAQSKIAESSQLRVCVRSWRARVLSRSRLGYTRVVQPVSPAHSHLPDADVDANAWPQATPWRMVPNSPALRLRIASPSRTRTTVGGDLNVLLAAVSPHLSLSRPSPPPFLFLSLPPSPPPPSAPSLSLYLTRSPTFAFSLSPARSAGRIPSRRRREEKLEHSHHHMRWRRPGLRINRTSKTAHNSFLLMCTLHCISAGDGSSIVISTCNGGGPACS
jgi:hypothetical protein